MSSPTNPPPVSDGNRYFDFFRHLTTLDFAAIGFLMVAFEQNMVKTERESTITVTFGCFGVSLIVSVLMMVFTMMPTGHWTSHDPDQNKFHHGWAKFFGSIAVVLFFLGMVTLGEATGLLRR